MIIVLALAAPTLQVFSRDLRQPIVRPCSSITNNLATNTTVTRGLPQPVEQTSAGGSHFTHTCGRSLLAQTIRLPYSRALCSITAANDSPSTVVTAQQELYQISALNNPRTYSLSSISVASGSPPPLIFRPGATRSPTRYALCIISEAQEFRRWAWSPASHQKPSRSCNSEPAPT